jgi:hypothetical protein
VTHGPPLPPQAFPCFHPCLSISHRIVLKHNATYPLLGAAVASQLLTWLHTSSSSTSPDHPPTPQQVTLGPLHLLFFLPVWLLPAFLAQHRPLQAFTQRPPLGCYLVCKTPWGPSAPPTTQNTHRNPPNPATLPPVLFPEVTSSTLDKLFVFYVPTRK